MRPPNIILRESKIGADELQTIISGRVQYLQENFYGSILLLRADASLNSVYWILASIYSGTIVAPIHPETTDEQLAAYKACLGSVIEVPEYYLEKPSTKALLEPKMEAVWAILFSSGSSGTAKAIALSGRNFAANAAAHASHHGLSEQDVWLLSLPMFHVGGFAVITRALFLNQNLAFTEKKMSAEEAQYWLSSPLITGISLVPTLLWRILESGKKFECSLKVILLGGSSISPDLILRAQAAELPIRVSYGLTESCSQLSAGKPIANAPGCAGTILPGFSVIIAADGEIAVRGDAVFSGYWKNAALHLAPKVEGYFYTQDLGHWGREGQLCIDGRKSDLIISGGENIFPSEIERVLLGHKLVQDVAVVGLPDPEWGEAVAAAVVLRDTLSPRESENQLLEYLRRNIMPWKIPKKFVFVNEIPRNQMNKIIRQEVAKLFLS